MPTSTRKRIQWQTVRLVTQPALKPNAQNPYAAMATAQRQDVFRDLARAILVRQAGGVHSN